MADNPFAKGCAYIEGDYFPISEARIPILDAGFNRSDLTYDVVAVWNGRFFRLEAHLDRFEKGFKQLWLNPGLTMTDIRDILFKCVSRSGLKNAYVEMIVTRGIDEDGSRDPRRFKNRFYAFAIPYLWIVKPEMQTDGIHLIIAEKTIRIPPQAVDPTVKNFQWGDLVRGIYEAYDRGGFTAVLLDADGHVTEGPGFNVFAYHEGQLLTPESGVLEGITRQTVLDLAEEQGIPARMGMFKSDVMENADEIFLTSTAGGVMPVTTLNGNRVGSGKPGQVTALLQKRYWEAHDEDRWTTKVEYLVE